MTTHRKGIDAAYDLFLLGPTHSIGLYYFRFFVKEPELICSHKTRDPIANDRHDSRWEDFINTWMGEAHGPDD